MIKSLALLALSLQLIQPMNAHMITHIEWGKVIVNVNGAQCTFKDCIVSPQGAHEWNWNTFNTRHVPGIQIEDVQSIVNDCDIIILSRGMDLVLQVKPETINFLKALGKEVHVLQSMEAVKLYNELVQQKKRVGLLLHTTC